MQVEYHGTVLGTGGTVSQMLIQTLLPGSPIIIFNTVVPCAH